MTVVVTRNPIFFIFSVILVHNFFLKISSWPKMKTKFQLHTCVPDDQRTERIRQKKHSFLPEPAHLLSKHYLERDPDGTQNKLHMYLIGQNLVLCPFQPHFSWLYWWQNNHIKSITNISREKEYWSGANTSNLTYSLHFGLIHLFNTLFLYIKWIFCFPSMSISSYFLFSNYKYSFASFILGFCVLQIFRFMTTLS